MFRIIAIFGEFSEEESPFDESVLDEHISGFRGVDSGE
jgi:hypothetical protein